MLTVQNNEIQKVEIVPIPKFRNLISFEGSLQEVREKIKSYSEKTPLISLAEIIVHEDSENLQTRQDFEEFINSNPNVNIEIIKSRLYFKTKIRGATDAFAMGTDVADVTPMQMFEKKLELQSGMQNTEELKNAFREIMQELKL